MVIKETVAMPGFLPDTRTVHIYLPDDYHEEERYDVLTARMAELGLKEEDYWWYLDLRKYGGVKHSGYGLGFERIIMYITGMSNIRDVLPFPRTPKTAEF